MRFKQVVEEFESEKVSITVENSSEFKAGDIEMCIRDSNMVVGVSEGYKKELELVGVGYRASNQGNIIEPVSYTHLNLKRRLK